MDNISFKSETDQIIPFDEDSVFQNNIKSARKSQLNSKRISNMSRIQTNVRVIGDHHKNDDQDDYLHNSQLSLGKLGNQTHGSRMMNQKQYDHYRMIAERINE